MPNHPPLTPFENRNCALCQDKMALKRVTAGPTGFEHRLFECPSCYNFETVVVASDPSRSNAAGWNSEDAGRSPVTHSIVDEKMIPRPAK